MSRRMLLVFGCVLALHAMPEQEQPSLTIDCRTADRWQYPRCYAAKPTGTLYRKGTNGKDIGANAEIAALVAECVEPGDMRAPACKELDRLMGLSLAAPRNLRIEVK